MASFAVLAVCVLPLAAQQLDPCFEKCHKLGMIAAGDDEDYETGAEVFEECMESFCN